MWNNQINKLYITNTTNFIALFFYNELPLVEGLEVEVYHGDALKEDIGPLLGEVLHSIKQLMTSILTTKISLPSQI